MIRDCSGEAFREIDVDLKEAAFLLAAPLTFMFISIQDLKDSAVIQLDTLMTNYLNSLAAHGVRLEREFRKIVVVLTKADLFLDDFQTTCCTTSMKTQSGRLVEWSQAVRSPGGNGVLPG